MILNRKNLKFEIDFDFILISITSPLKDYRLCYLINRQLNFNFIKKDDFELDFDQPGSLRFFSLYHHYWESSDTDFYFIANKGSDGYLIPEMRTADYFILIKNYIAGDELESMIFSINKITEIVAAVKIDPKKIKSRENLLF